MAEEKVILEKSGSIAYVGLNNPERYNALSHQVVEGLQDVARRLATDPEVRAVVLHGGESRAFCAGADLKERQGMTEEQVFGTVHLLRETVNLYERLPMPVIAAIHGMAFGGGCELALACDLRVMAADAQVGLTETSLAIIPGAGGCVRLPQLVGLARAKELIYTARKLTAQEALELGLVNQVVAREQLMPAATELAQRIAANGPLAIRAAKRAIDGAVASASGLALEWEAYQSIVPTQDRLEGLRAFAEKRPPVYRGQ